MNASEWIAATADPDEQDSLLIFALCREPHPLGSVASPSEAHLRQCAARRSRDEDIRAVFEWNYAELARRHRLSTRQIRRIVDEPRKGQASPLTTDAGEWSSDQLR